MWGTKFHTEGITFIFFSMVLVLLIGTTYFTTFAKDKPVLFTALICATVAVMRYIAAGPRAKYLPEGASNVEDFRSRPVDERPWAGKVAVVTGSNMGLGYETVRSIAFLGAHIVFVDIEDAEKGAAAIKRVGAETGNDRHDYLQLDLVKFPDIQGAALQIAQKACQLRGMQPPDKHASSGFPCIDFLVNNAGRAAVGRPFTPDGFDLVFATNYLGPYVLTEWLLPYVSHNGRIINLASCAHTWWKMLNWSLDPQYCMRRVIDDCNNEQHNLITRSNGGYAISKFCNLVHACVLNKRLQENPQDRLRDIKTASLHPGAVASNIWRIIPYPIKYIWDFVMLLFFKTCNEGHQTTLHCLTAPHIISGGYYVDCGSFRPRDEARDEKNWDVVEDWTRDKMRAFLPK